MASHPRTVPLEQDGSADYAGRIRPPAAPPPRGRLVTTLASLARRVRRRAST